MTDCTASLIFSADVNSNVAGLGNRGHGEKTKVIKVIVLEP